MTFLDILTSFVLTVSPVIEEFFICVVVIMLCFVLLLILSRKIWVNSKFFSITGFFYRLSNYDAICISGVFVSLVLMIIYIVQFKKLELIHYLVYVLPSLIYVFKINDFKYFYKRLFWLIVELIVLFISNILCSYILEVFAYPWFILVYVLFGIFCVFIGIYRFLLAIEDISDLRGYEIV